MKKRFLRNITLTALAALCWCGQGGASVMSAQQGQATNVAAFAGTNKFYVGTNDDANNLARYQLKRTTGAAELDIKTLTAVGNIVTVNTTAKQASPVSGKDISLLTVTPDGYPVAYPAIDEKNICLIRDIDGGTKVLKTTTDLQDHTPADTAGVVALAASTEHVFAGVKVTAGDFGAAGSGIAMIKINDTPAGLVNLNPWTGKEAAPAAYGLQVGAGNDDSANGLVRIAKTGDATVEDPKSCDLYWDDQLERLFVGINTVKALGANANVPVVTDFLVGRLDETAGIKKLVLRAGVNTTDTDNDAWDGLIPAAGTVTSPVGVTAGAAGTDYYCALYKVRTMHTSTGKDYVIVNGGASAADVTADGAEKRKLQSKVTALPIMPKGTKFAGILAKTNNANAYAVIDDPAQLDDTADKAKVGVNPEFLGHCKSADGSGLGIIKDMQIAGDKVYVSVAGARGAVSAGADNADAEEAGIFSSTALFDEFGNIRAWTPWERCLGVTRKVDGFGVDQTTGDIWYVGKNGDDADYAKYVTVSQWNKGNAASHTDLTKTLPSALATATPAANFVQQNNGVLGVFNFDGQTDCFEYYNDFPGKTYESFSMMVATGYGRVALIEAGKYDGTAGHQFVVTPEYKNTVDPSTGALGDTKTGAAGDTIFVYDSRTKAGAQLANLGAITCAEVSRKAGAGNGWLFVGGKGGLAVLAKHDDGAGWDGDALATLAHDAAPCGDNWQFTQITKNAAGTALDLSDVRKLQSDGVYLYILTKDKLHRITMAAAGFTNTKQLAAANNYVEITSVATMKNHDAGAFLLDASVDEFYDMAIVDKTDAASFVMLATSKGVFVNKTGIQADAAGMADQKWDKPWSAGGAADDAFECGPAFKLDFVNKERGGKPSGDVYEGNLYVTALDKDEQNVCVYRFNVSGGWVAAMTEPYKDAAGTVTPYFYKLGSVADLGGDLPVNDAFDMQPQAKDFGSHGTAGDFIGGVAMTPDPAYFLKAGQAGSAIDLGLDLNNGFQIASVVKDTASGALYVPGQFGVRVNE